MKKKCKIVGLVALCMMFTGTYNMSAVAADNETIIENVYIGSTCVGGMTKEQAKAACENMQSELAESYVTFVCNDKEKKVGLDEIDCTVSVEDVVDNAYAIGHKGNVLKRYKDKHDFANGKSETFGVSAAVGKDTKKLIGKLLEEFNCKEEPASISLTDDGFEVIPEVRGISVDVSKTVKKLEKELEENTDNKNIELEVVCEEVIPELNEEVLGQIKDVLGHFETDYKGDSGRMANVENATSFLNGTLLMPGDTLDVNAAFEPYTLENGYFYAGEYSNGKVVQGIGGGICQVSTTLYNAMLLAEVEIVERYNHSLTVGYVPLSMDAAIAGTTKNLVVKNNLEYPIYILGKCENGIVSFDVFGKEERPSNRTLEFESVMTGTIPPGEAVVTEDGSLEPGSRITTQKPRQGYTAELWKHIYVDGVLKDSVLVNSSRYNSTPEYVTVGPEAAPGEDATTETGAEAITEENTDTTETTEAPEEEPEEEPEEPEEEPGDEVEPEEPENVEG